MIRTRGQKQKSQRKTQRKNQRGGNGDGGYGFHGAAFNTTMGTPVETRIGDYTQCNDLRAANTPEIGHLKTVQFGGACMSCGAAVPPMQNQKGGGGGHGGYAVNVHDNSLIGMVSSRTPYPCPPPSVANQVGGSSVSDQIVSYKTGFGYVTPYNSNNANFAEVTGYDRTVMAGGRRTYKNKNKSKSKSKKMKHRHTKRCSH